jgi:lambda family phage tail tape measure protein
MSDLIYRIGVETKQARQSIDKLQQRVDTTSQTFGRLKTVIAGIAIGAFVRNAVLMANSLNDLSLSTDIARDAILGFTQALSANGSTVDRARDGLTDFVKNLGEAANGSTELQRAFAQAGVSLNELATLSEQDLLRDTIQGLSEIDDTATRSASAMRIFGESFKGVDITGVNSDLDSFIANNKETADSLRVAGEASQNMKNAFFELQLVVLQAIHPLTELTNELLSNSDTVKNVLKNVVDLTVVLGGLYILSKLITLVAGLGTAFVALKALLAGTTIAAGGLAAVFSGLVPILALLAAGYQLLDVVVERLTGRDIAGWIATWADDLERVVTKTFPELARLINETGDALGLERSDRYSESLGEAKDEVDKTNKLLEDQNSTHSRIREIINAQAEAARKVFETYERTNEVTLRTLRQQRDMIGLTEDQAEMQSNLNSITNSFEDQLDTLLKQYDKLAKKPRENAEQMQVLLKTINKVTGEYQDQFVEASRITAEIVSMRNALEAAQLASQKLSDALARSKTFITDVNDSTRDFRREIAQVNMNPLERQIDDINNQIRDDLADAVSELEAAKTKSNADEIEREIQRITIAAESAIATQTRLATESASQQRTFASGWRRAFEQYQDDATNAAKTAEKVFEQTTSGLEDMIVGFTKTGKFEWEDFVADITDTLLRSELRKLIGTTFGSLGLGNIGGSGSSQQRGENASTPLFVQDVNGGLGGATGSGLFGSAATPGINPAAGDSGGGIIGSLGGIASSVGNLFGGSSANSFASQTPGRNPREQDTSFLGGVADTVGDFFGGFFATGGTLAAGKFGVVGENGPELVTGPANITPGMGGGNVTYNINAVDASSFKQMVARDPGFIHAVAQQGAKKVPGGR